MPEQNISAQKNNVSKNTGGKAMKTNWRWIFIIIILAIIPAYILGKQSQKADQEAQNISAQQTKQADAKLQYIASIKDDDKMALNGAHEFAIKDKYLYVTGTKDNGITIFDITRPDKPKFVNTIFDNENTYLKKLHSLIFKGNYGFAGDMEDGAIQALDFTDPINPKPLSFLKDGDTTGLKGLHGMAITGNYLYVAGMSENALEIIDISDPANIKHVNVIYDNDKLSLKAPHSIAFKDNYAYIVGADEGIEVMDITDPEKPAHIEMFTENEHGHSIRGAHDAEIFGNYLYVASYVDGFGVFDISNPRAPFEVAEIHPTNDNGLKSAADLKITKKYAFVASEAENALTIIDIANPARPRVLDVVKDDGTGNMYVWNAHFVDAIGDYIYVAGMQDGFGILKVIN